MSARWAELMELPEERVPLDEAALLISAHANPALDVAAQLQRLDEIAAVIVPPEVPVLCRVLFGQLGLRGDRERYDDPLNSYIDQVLDRRRGIPISLSVVLIEVGRRCGLRLDAVGMPGHFLVRDPATPEELIDAFDGGRRLGHGECEQLLRAATGGAAPLTPEMLSATRTWTTLARMLLNLDGSFGRRRDYRSLSWVSELRLGIPRTSLADRAQLAGRLATLGRLDVAATVLEDAAGATTAADARPRLLAEAATFRARLN